MGESTAHNVYSVYLFTNDTMYSAWVIVYTINRVSQVECQGRGRRYRGGTPMPYIGTTPSQPMQKNLSYGAGALTP